MRSMMKRLRRFIARLRLGAAARAKQDALDALMRAGEHSLVELVARRDALAAVNKILVDLTAAMNAGSDMAAKGKMALLIHNLRKAAGTEGIK